MKRPTEVVNSIAYFFTHFNKSAEKLGAIRARSLETFEQANMVIEPVKMVIEPVKMVIEPVKMVIESAKNCDGSCKYDDFIGNHGDISNRCEAFEKTTSGSIGTFTLTIACTPRFFPVADWNSPFS